MRSEMGRGLSPAADGPRPRRFGFGSAGRALGRLAHGLLLVGPGGAAAEAGLEGLHQVDDLGLRLLGRGGGDLASLDLLLDRGVVTLADLVLVVFGMELLGGDR